MNERDGRRVLVVGAGVAGVATAYWLRRYGLEPTVVERSESLRSGGHDIDLRGQALDVVADMGVLDALRERQTPRRETVIVDRAGTTVDVLPPERFSGDLEIDQTDLVDVLAGTLGPDDVVFGDTVTALDGSGDGVQVTFARSEPRTVDLVVGADGVHSGVRRLVFGPEDRFAEPLGLLAAGFHTPGTFGRVDRNWFHRTGGGSAGVACRADRDTMHVVLCVADDGTGPRDAAAATARIAGGLRDAGWEVPALVEALLAAPDPYLDMMTVVRVPSWARGRVVLVGDAAGCASPTSGRGTSQALLGARVLAAELAGTDHADAFAAYEGRLRPTVEHHQRVGAAGARWFLGSEPGDPGPEPPPVGLPG